MGKGQTLKRLPFAFLGIKSFGLTINILIKCLTYKLEMSSNILSILKFAFIFLTLFLEAAVAKAFEKRCNIAHS